MSDTDLQSVKDIAIVTALSWIARGLSKEKACKAANISVSTLDRRIQDNPELISDFIAGTRAKIQTLYEDIFSAEVHLVKQLVQDAYNDDLKPKDRLAVHVRLREVRKDIETQLSVFPSEEEMAEPQPLPPTANPVDAENFIQNIFKPPQLKRGTNVTTSKATGLDEEIVDGEVKS